MTNFSDLYTTYLKKGNKTPRGRCYTTQLGLLAAGSFNSDIPSFSIYDSSGLYYVMINKRIYPARNIMPYWEWYTTAERHISQTWVKDGKANRKRIQGGVWVSTVFLGLNHNFGDPTPVLFETMCFGDIEEYQSRATTIDEAKMNHKIMVQLVINEQVS